MREPDPLDDDGFEEAIKRRQRIKMIVGIALGLVAVGGAIAAYLVLWADAPKARCDQKDVKTFLAKKKAPGELVYQVCRLPEPLEQTLRQLASTPPEMQRLKVFKMVADSPDLVTSVCRDAPKAIVAALAKDPTQQSEEFLKTCNLRQTGLGSRRVLEQALLHRLLLAVAVYGALIGTDRPHALKLGKKMLEIVD